MDVEADYEGRKRLKVRWKESSLGVNVHQLWYIWELQTGVQTGLITEARTATFKLHQQILKLVCHQSQCEYHPDKLKDES